jgi:uridylate kinase
MGEKQYGIDEKRLGEYAQQIAEIVQMGVQVGIVIGDVTLSASAQQFGGQHK